MSVFRDKQFGIEESYRRIIKEVRHEAFEDSDVWTNEPFFIPGLAPSTLPNCNIIHIQYCFEVNILKNYKNMSSLDILNLNLIIII